jgi:transposase
VPPDNNRSEAALRVVALGRKNFLFVATKTPAPTSLVSTPRRQLRSQRRQPPCEYLRDVMLRISTHPADRIDELLPDRWTPQNQPCAATASAAGRLRWRGAA